MSYINEGTVLLVTGATGEIGFEIARQAAASGAVVAIHGGRQETVDAAIERLRVQQPDARLIAAPGDFTRPGVIQAVVDKVVEEAGRLDAVIHCSIVVVPSAFGLFSRTKPEHYDQLAGNILGIFQKLVFAALPHLEEQGGTIVGFISDAGRFSAPNQALLGAAFGGIISFVRNLAFEVARNKVRLHCISPSFVKETRAFELVGVGGRGETAEKRAGLGLPSPKDLAPVALFLCGTGATKITGQVISVNGGLST